MWNNNSLIWIYTCVSSGVTLVASSIMLLADAYHHAAVLAQNEVITNYPMIWDTLGIRACCIIGSVLGGFLSISILVPNSDDFAVNVRRGAIKFFASICGGLMFAPVALRWTGLPIDPDTVMFMAGIMSFCTTSLLHKIIPFVESYIDKHTKT
jgi:hypothetical protein